MLFDSPTPLFLHKKHVQFLCTESVFEAGLEYDSHVLG